MTATPRRAVLVLLAAALLAPIACSSGPTPADPGAGSPKVKRQELTFEAFFSAADQHPVEDCLGGMAAVLEDPLKADGVLFWDRESKIVIRPPHLKGNEAYHCHVYHRDTGGKLLPGKVIPQREDGVLEVDLLKFGTPELLIVTTMPLRSRAKGASTSSEGATPIAAPYTLSFRLVPNDQAVPFAAAQDFRYDWRAGAGPVSLQLFVQSCGRDMLLTLVNPDRKGTEALSQGLFYWPKEEGIFAPRLTVEVANDGAVWMRSAAYIVPEPARAAIAKGEEPFSLRVGGRDWIRFAPPPTLDARLVDEHPATSARVAVRFAGMRPDSKIRLALAAGYPVAGERLRVLVQEDDVAAEKTERTYVVSLDHEDPSRFPLSGYVAWRAVQPWKTPGGFLDVREPLGRFVGTLREEEQVRSLPQYMITPRFSSHYQAAWFWGKAGTGENELAKTLASWYWGSSTSGTSEDGDGGPSPNMTPPPWIYVNVPGEGSSSVYIVPLLETPSDDPAKCGCWPGGLSCKRNTNTIVGDQAECQGKCGKECPENGHCFPLSASGSDEGYCGCWPGGKWCARDTNGVAGDEGECKGQCGEKCPANGHCKSDLPAKLLVPMLCMKKKQGCGLDAVNTDPDKQCKCNKEQWTKAALKDGIGKALAEWAGSDKNTENLILADPGDPQPGRKPGAPHLNPEGHVPCHEETYVCMVKAQWWNGTQAIYMWYKVYVIFGPCVYTGGIGKDDKKDDTKGEPEGFGRLFDGQEPLTSGLVGRVVPATEEGPRKSDTVSTRLSPSADPSLAPRLAHLVASTRRAFGDSDVPPRFRSLAWAVPIRVLTFTKDKWTAKVREEAEYARKFDSVYWRPEKLKRLEASSTSLWYEGIWDRPVYLGAAAQREGGGGR